MHPMRSVRLCPEGVRSWGLVVAHVYILVTVLVSRSVLGSPDRHLLAASAPGPGAACGLRIQGVTKTFTQCQSLTAELGDDYTVLWDYIPLATSSGSGQPQGRLDVAIDAAAKSNSWIGFGIPENPGEMIGASAVIVRTNITAPSGATGAQYLLGGYSVSKVTTGGFLKVQNLTSAFANGRLQGAFTLAQATPVDGRIPIIVAMGPLKADGSLQQHTSFLGAELPIAPAATSPAVSPSAAASRTPPSAAASLLPQSATLSAQPPATSAAPQLRAASPTPAGASATSVAPQISARSPTPAVAPATSASASPQSPAASPTSPVGAPGPVGGAVCGLQFQGATETFAKCQSLSGDLGDDYTVLWNYTPLAGLSAGGAAQGRLDVAIDAAAKADSYVGFGIPENPGEMIGASAIIVKTDGAAPSGASATQYLLGGYSVDQVTPGGKLVVQNLTSAYSKGRLQALFTLAQVPASESKVDIIAAFGALTADGSLQHHEAASAAKLPTVAGASTPATSPSGAAPVLPQSGTVPPPSGTASVLPQSVTASPPANLLLARDPGGGVSAVSAPAGSAGCGLTAPGQPERTFTACTTLAGVTPDLKLLWSVNDGKAAAGGRRLQASESLPGGMYNVTFAVDAAKPDGWVGVGIPSTPGQMVGADAMFFGVCPECPTGAKAEWRYLAAKSTAGVQGPGRIPVENVEAWAADGRILGSFDLQVDPANLAGQHLIYASGPVSPSGTYLYHSDGEGGITVDLTSGAVSGGGGIAHLRKLSMAHGWMMTVSWGVLIPLGAVIARNFKTLGPTWFNIHRVVQTAGWLLGWGAFGIGVHITTTYNLHQRLGIAIQILGTLQVFLAVVAKPTHESGWRRTWNLGHWWIGRTAIALGIANVYLGLIDEAAQETKYVLAYSVVLGAIVVTAMSKESYDYLSLPPPAVDCARAPQDLSTDPTTAPKSYANLVFRRGALSRGGRGSASLVRHPEQDINGSRDPMTPKVSDGNVGAA